MVSVLQFFIGSLSGLSSELLARVLLRMHCVTGMIKAERSTARQEGQVGFPGRERTLRRKEESPGRYG